MSKFSQDNFKRIINEIEQMELQNENIWVPIGILERMYNDYIYIDDYFHCNKTERDIDQLIDQLNFSSLIN